MKYHIGASYPSARSDELIYTIVYWDQFYYPMKHANLLGMGRRVCLGHRILPPSSNGQNF